MHFCSQSLIHLRTQITSQTLKWRRYTYTYAPSKHHHMPPQDDKTPPCHRPQIPAGCAWKLFKVGLNHTTRLFGAPTLIPNGDFKLTKDSATPLNTSTQTATLPQMPIQETKQYRTASWNSHNSLTQTTPGTSQWVSKSKRTSEASESKSSLIPCRPRHSTLTIWKEKPSNLPYTNNSRENNTKANIRYRLIGNWEKTFKLEIP